MLAVAGCLNGIDPDWQLDHTRVVAIRATPPSIPADATSVIDALVAHKGSATDVEAPVVVTVAMTAPAALLGVSVALDGSDWTVTAPSDDVIEEARTELMLDDGTPVPLELGVVFGGSADALVSTKLVYLGSAADNPMLTNTMIDGQPAPAAGSAIVVPGDVDVPLVTDADPTTDSINWLTSCGTMHDDDEIKAFVHVLPTDPQTGELAVVRRNDANGGVAFETWPMSATPAGSGSSQ